MALPLAGAMNAIVGGVLTRWPTIHMNLDSTGSSLSWSIKRKMNSVSFLMTIRGRTNQMVNAIALIRKNAMRQKMRLPAILWIRDMRYLSIVDDETGDDVGGDVLTPKSKR